jgi:hypothetical protein
VQGERQCSGVGAREGWNEPFAYLRFLFERLPAAECIEDFEALSPYRLDGSLLASP